MQHQFRIGKEIVEGTVEQNAVASRRGASPQMQTAVGGIFDQLNVADTLAKDPFQRFSQPIRHSLTGLNAFAH
jgi:hypothetical protein